MPLASASGPSLHASPLPCQHMAHGTHAWPARLLEEPAGAAVRTDAEARAALEGEGRRADPWVVMSGSLADALYGAPGDADAPCRISGNTAGAGPPRSSSSFSADPLAGTDPRAASPSTPPPRSPFDFRSADSPVRADASATEAGLSTAGAGPSIAGVGSSTAITDATSPDATPLRGIFSWDPPKPVRMHPELTLRWGVAARGRRPYGTVAGGGGGRAYGTVAKRRRSDAGQLLSSLHQASVISFSAVGDALTWCFWLRFDSS
jgi:hypothetical protein